MIGSRFKPQDISERFPNPNSTSREADALHVASTRLMLTLFINYHQNTMAARTKIYNVWFWAPFHMLQAYPMARNLPIPDFLIPLAHLMWLPMYIAEHWTGLAAPVEDAWNMKSFTAPFSSILLLSFFYTTHGLSENQTIVKIGFVMYFSFYLFAENLGFKGKPQSTQKLQIAANKDPEWNYQHIFLHVYYVVILWVVTLTVPYSKLAAVRAGE